MTDSRKVKKDLIISFGISLTYILLGILSITLSNELNLTWLVDTVFVPILLSMMAVAFQEDGGTLFSAVIILLIGCSIFCVIIYGLIRLIRKILRKTPYNRVGCPTSKN